MPTLRPRKLRFNIPEIMCPGGCGNDIITLLSRKDSRSQFLSENILVNWVNKYVTVKMDPKRTETDEALIRLIQADLSERFVVDGIQLWRPGIKTRSNRQIWTEVFNGLLGLVAGFSIMIAMASGFAIPLVAMGLMAGAATLLTAYLGRHRYKSAYNQFRENHTLGKDALFAVSTITAVAVSLTAFFIPWLPMMFDAALLIFGFSHLGAAIETAAIRTVMQDVSLRDRVPREIKRGTNKTVVDIKELRENDIIYVGGGCIIPVDGICLDEESSIYEKFKGQVGATTIKKGHPLLAGMVVDDPKYVKELTMQVLKEEKESTLAIGDECINESAPAPIENTANKILRYFVPALFGLAIATSVVIGIFFAPIVAIQCAITILVSACPCALGLITPMAINIGMNKAREHDVEFKQSKYLQTAATIDAIAFDLNGTLTTGVKSVANIEIHNPTDFNEKKIAGYLYILEEEAMNHHEVAHAIFSYAKDKIKHRVYANNVTFVTKPNDKGVRAHIGSNLYTLGNEKMMTDYDITLDTTLPKGQIYLARNDRIIATLNMKDTLRQDTIIIIKELKKTIHPNNIYLITGDTNTAAENICNQLGIRKENIYSNHEAFGDNSKVQAIKDIQSKQHRVAFVGDGINDKHAMIQSDLGICMNETPSNDESTESSAGVVIGSSTLRPILSMFEISKQTFNNMKLSLATSFACSIGVQLLCFGLMVGVGIANPVIGVALMIVPICLVCGIAYYHKRQNLSAMANTNVVMPNESTQPCSTSELGKIFELKPTPPVTPVMARSEATKQSMPEQRQELDCFASLATTKVTMTKVAMT